MEKAGFDDETQRVCNIIEQYMYERQSLIHYLRKDIISYKLALEGVASADDSKALDVLSVVQLMEMHSQLRRAYQKRLEEEYGVNPYRKI